MHLQWPEIKLECEDKLFFRREVGSLYGKIMQNYSFSHILGSPISIQHFLGTNGNVNIH